MKLPSSFAGKHFRSGQEADGRMLAVTENVQELVRQCLAGEESAMAALVDRYKHAVFALCFRMLSHREDAEDAAQETFVRMLRSLHHWDPSRPFEPWVLTIAGNRCRTALGRRARRPNTTTLIESPPDGVCEEADAHHLAEEVQLALADVRAEYRQAFLLFTQHELSYAEIAEEMDIPLGTVKTWVHRGRRELIQRLAARDVIEDPKSNAPRSRPK